MDTIGAVQIDANLDGLWTAAEVVDTFIFCQTAML